MFWGSNPLLFDEYFEMRPIVEMKHVYEIPNPRDSTLDESLNSGTHKDYLYLTIPVLGQLNYGF